MRQKMQPEIEVSLNKKGVIITPYVNVWGGTPKRGWSQFFDSPRYSTGYTTMFNTLGLMVETHMLKPYKIRVEQTYALMHSLIEFTENNSKEIKALRAKAKDAILAKKAYPIQFKIDRENYTDLNFKGYEGEIIDSKVTNGKRLFYNKERPFDTIVKYFDNFLSTKEIIIPKAYIIPQGWHEIIQRLDNNQISYTRFEKDTILEVTVNHIKDYKTRTSAYEGHYLHYNTSVKSTVQKIAFRSGDIFIDTNQEGIRYLLETLEAEATDSFFNWNFFDTILQQKEGYSSYVFEDVAEQLLKDSPELKKLFDEKMKDENFSKNPRQQLDFIHKNSPYYESAHLRLPIFKVY